MAGRLCLALLLLVAVSAHAASVCPRGLHAVLGSPACSGHRVHMAHAARTTIDLAIIGDICVNSLRTLFTVEVPMPCVASLEASGPTHTRRLSDDDPFKGKLKCTFDKASPLNVTDLNQSFIIDCEEVDEPYNYTWLYVVLGVVGGGLVIWGLLVVAKRCINEIQQRLKTRRERLEQEAIDKAEAPPAGHPYALA